LDQQPAPGSQTRPSTAPALRTAGGGKTGEAPMVPTLRGPHGIRFDFNDGCRVALPAGDWRVQVRDLDTDNILFDQALQGVMVQTSKRYFVRFGLRIWKDGEIVLSHDYDARGQQVLIRMELGGIGDQLAWFGHVAAFAERHGCQVTCCMRGAVLPLLIPAYPAIKIVQAHELDAAAFYASYKVLIFYNDDQNVYQPSDYRLVGLCQTAAYILGLEPVERKPRIAIEAGGRPVAERYVCIATQATTQNKYWNNPFGWREVIAFLKESGYRVFCIDLLPVTSNGLVSNQIPYGAEDLTGDRPLAERARWLHHADMFIGLSSGLAWLAWAAGVPVVMISGFTHPLNEFHTPYRVINWHACNSCSNDVRLQLDPADYFWCPRHKGTPRQFECTRLITPTQVKTMIRRVPGFAG
jgi:autotransporter strand-loop-strand O-heptosyltransferase